MSMAYCFIFYEYPQTPNTPRGRRQMPVAVNIFMLTVAAIAALANSLISSVLPNVPFDAQNKPFLASKTSCFAAQMRPF